MKELPDCKVIANVDRLTEDNWRLLRKKFIGGSDAAGCMGQSKYASPYTIVADKLSLSPEFTGNEATERGKFFEPIIFQSFPAWYEKENHREIKFIRHPYFLQSTKLEFMSANLDGLCIHPDFGLIGLEIKTAARRDGWDYESLPDAYYAQLQHYMFVTGLETFMIVVLFLDPKGGYFYHTVPRNDEYIDWMIEDEKRVWEYIKSETLPAPGGTDADVSAVNHIANGEPVEDLIGLLPTLRELDRITKDKKRYEEEERKLKNYIKSEMGGRGVAKAGNYTIKFSDVVTTRFDEKRFKLQNKELAEKYMYESSYAKMTIKGGKK